MSKKKGSPKGQTKGMKVSYEVDGENIGEWNQPTPKNHLRQGKIYDDFCVLNQEFLKYVLSCGLTGIEMKLFIFLLSYMDYDNKIIICPIIANRQLGISESNFNKYIKKLEGRNLILKRALGYKNGSEVMLNFDVISPYAAFRNKNNKNNVEAHQLAMRNIPAPYIKQTNINGMIDLINPETGEVFHESKIK